MNEPYDPDNTADIPAPAADSLDAGLAAGYGPKAQPPRSTFGKMQTVLLKEAEGESGHVVKPKSDAMPVSAEAGDRYQLSGEIARGGMGAVLRGRDVDLGRDLAVKVLLDKFTHRPEVARRFIEEAQIGGQLQHPGVVPVYDIGHFGDRPFFTMKLIKGQTLSALLEARAGVMSDQPRFLAIVLQVSQTLAYAHAKGVIHRDLKPANIMVGAFGEVQVMDWGLAKVLAEGGIADEERAARDQEQLEDFTQIRTARSAGSAGSFGTDTEAGSLLGTPAYMPPEQANGDAALLDRKADVFGLGAILCEVLTGKPPYLGRSGEEVRRKAANGDLADAITRLESCGAEMELIALTRACLSPEAVDRPKDAQSVANKLSTYLNGVIQRMRQAELAEAKASAKAVEEVKRRRLTMALAATVLLAVMLGCGGWLWVKGERNSRQAALTRDVNDAFNKSTALREQARTATIGSAALYAKAREQAQRALALIANGPTDPALISQVTRLQSDLDEEEKDRRLLNALDEARLAEAETVSGENRYAAERALPLFREAFRAYGLPAGEGDTGVAAERIRNRPEPIREVIIEALDDWHDVASHPVYQISEPHLAWLKSVIAAAEPNDPWTKAFRAILAEKDLKERRANLEELMKSTDTAKVPVRSILRFAKHFQPLQAATLLRRAQQQFPADFWVNHDLGLALQKQSPPELDDAVRFLTAAVALRPESPGALNNLGLALNDNGQFDEALAVNSKAIALAPTYTSAITGLGSALLGKGQVDEAIASYRKAVELDPKYALAHYNLGLAYVKKSQIDDAIASYRKCIEFDPTIAKTHFNLGNALYSKGQIDEAIANYEKSIELDDKYAPAHNNLGRALAGKGQVNEASASFHNAIRVDPKHVSARINLGNILYSQGVLNEAILSFRKALELNSKSAGAHLNLGTVLLESGQLDEALLELRLALDLDPKEETAPVLFAQAESLVAIQNKLLSHWSSEFTASSNDERLEQLKYCHFKKWYRAAAKLYVDAFAADPTLSADTVAQHRYNASCFAALAAAGQGGDAAQLDDGARASLRKLVLEWLRADLAMWSQQLESNMPAARNAVQQTLKHWQQDNDLTAIRDAEALAKLSTEERETFSLLWADVAALLKKAEETQK